MTMYSFQRPSPRTRVISERGNLSNDMCANVCGCRNLIYSTKTKNIYYIGNGKPRLRDCVAEAVEEFQGILASCQPPIGADSVPLRPSVA